MIHQVGARAVVFPKSPAANLHNFDCAGNTLFRFMFNNYVIDVAEQDMAHVLPEITDNIVGFQYLGIA